MVLTTVDTEVNVLVVVALSVVVVISWKHAQMDTLTLNSGSVGIWVETGSIAITSAMSAGEKRSTVVSVASNS